MKYLREALRNPSIRRVVVAFATFNFGEWATWVAVLVYAFERGGATESGIVAFTMLVPAAIVAPIVASVGGRFRRERMLLAAYVVQAVVMAAGAAALFAGAPSRGRLRARDADVDVGHADPARPQLDPAVAGGHDRTS